MPPQPTYTNPEVMQAKIDEYFAECEKGIEVIHVTGKGEKVPLIKPRVPTVEGLLRVLGFATRKSLIDYEAKPAFVNVVRRAKNKLAELNMVYGAAGLAESRLVSLNLCSNYGYSPKSSLEVSRPEGQASEEHQGELDELHEQLMARRRSKEDQEPAGEEKTLH